MNIRLKASGKIVLGTMGTGVVLIIENRVTEAGHKGRGSLWIFVAMALPGAYSLIGLLELVTEARSTSYQANGTGLPDGSAES